MESEDRKDNNSSERRERRESSRHSRSRSNSYSRRSRSRDRHSHHSRPHYEYDDGRNNRNEGNTLYGFIDFWSYSLGILVIFRRVWMKIA